MPFPPLSSFATSCTRVSAVMCPGAAEKIQSGRYSVALWLCFCCCSCQVCHYNVYSGSHNYIFYFVFDCFVYIKRLTVQAKKKKRFLFLCASASLLLVLRHGFGSSGNVSRFHSAFERHAVISGQIIVCMQLQASLGKVCASALPRFV